MRAHTRHVRARGDEPVWLPEVKRLSPKTPIILVGNKADLRNDSNAITELAAQGSVPISSEEGKVRVHVVAPTICTAGREAHVSAEKRSKMTRGNACMADLVHLCM